MLILVSNINKILQTDILHGDKLEKLEETYIQVKIKSTLFDIYKVRIFLIFMELLRFFFLYIVKKKSFLNFIPRLFFSFLLKNAGVILTNEIVASEKKGASFKLHCGENLDQKRAKIQILTMHAIDMVVQEKSTGYWHSIILEIFALFCP